MFLQGDELLDCSGENIDKKKEHSHPESHLSISRVTFPYVHMRMYTPHHR